MSIISEKIEGDVISVTINSSNLRSAVYNTTNKTLLMEFSNSSTYEYVDVPWDTFTKFRMTESQGKFFNANIAKSFKYTKK